MVSILIVFQHTGRGVTSHQAPVSGQALGNGAGAECGEGGSRAPTLRRGTSARAEARPACLASPRLPSHGAHSAASCPLAFTRDWSGSRSCCSHNTQVQGIADRRVNQDGR